MRVRATIALALAAALLAAKEAQAIGKPRIAALQVALRSHQLYAGAVDGVRGPDTVAAVRALQRRAGIVADGVLGPRTRRALGRWGRPDLGTRPLRQGRTGWDVGALQFLLAWHGFPSGPFDGSFGPRTDAALRRFQLGAGLLPDGVVGPATLAALARPAPRCPLSLAWPLAAAVGDGFGPRDTGFHAGIDLPADLGTPVAAARSGVVAYASWLDGYGNLVTIAHASGVRTMYAHLSRIDVAVGQSVAAGEPIALVGSTGHSTGPHLHFEVRVRGAAVDPLTGLSR